MSSTLPPLIHVFIFGSSKQHATTWAVKLSAFSDVKNDLASLGSRLDRLLARWVSDLRLYRRVQGRFVVSERSTENTMMASLIARFMGPTWGRQDPGGPHVGPMKFAIWDMQMILFCLFVFFSWYIHLPIFVRVASVVMWQSFGSNCTVLAIIIEKYFDI